MVSLKAWVSCVLLVWAATAVLPARGSIFCQSIPAAILENFQPVAVYAHSNLSTDNFHKLAKRLEELGFTFLAKPTHGEPILGVVAAYARKAISELAGVHHLEIPNVEFTEVWRNGRKRIRDTVFNDADYANRERWLYMRQPVTDAQTRDLRQIRKVAREKGVVVVIPDQRPSDPAAVRALEEMWGAKVFFAGDLPEGNSIVRVPGVALHFQPTSDVLRVRGEINPLLGFGHLHGTLDKVVEMVELQKHVPEAVGSSLMASSLMNGHSRHAFAQLREAVRLALDSFLNTKSSEWGLHREEALVSLLTKVFEAAKHEFPDGAFFKWRNDYATMESENLITTMETNPRKLAQDYLEVLAEIKKGHAGGSIKDEAVRDAMEEWELSSVMIVDSILNSPRDVIVQEALPVMKTPLGNKMEFRVDVMQGRVVNVPFRYGLEYFPDEAAGAKAFVEKVLRKMPGHFRFISGGFDVVMLKDGSYKIIELNAGNNSGTMLSNNFPIDGNMALSNFLGQPTPLIQKLDGIYKTGLGAQVAYIKSLPVETDEKTSINDIAKYEAMCYFRDRYLSDWAAKRPTRASGDEVVQTLRRLVNQSGRGRDEAFKEILQGSRNYVNRTLSK